VGSNPAWSARTTTSYVCPGLRSSTTHEDASGWAQVTGDPSSRTVYVAGAGSASAQLTVSQVVLSPTPVITAVPPAAGELELALGVGVGTASVVAVRAAFGVVAALGAVAFIGLA
jgi:hypothetical protein